MNHFWPKSSNKTKMWRTSKHSMDSVWLTNYYLLNGRQEYYKTAFSKQTCHRPVGNRKQTFCSVSTWRLLLDWAGDAALRNKEAAGGNLLRRKVM